VWFALARLLERAGTTAAGSITLLATVLSADDDERDPLAETARSLLDGHIVLSRSLARAGRFPAVDVLASAIRTMPAVAGAAHLEAARSVRATLAVLAETEDLRAAGMADLSDPALRRALDTAPALEAFLRERTPQPAAATLAALSSLAADAGLS
jgi:flagellar biosynthesis/type III secretory pathway ATPase